MPKSKFTWMQEEEFIKAFINFSIDDAIGWIQRNLDPEDVFDENSLDRWANNNGFRKEE